MSTPKRPGDQIWQIYPGKSDDRPPHLKLAEHKVNSSLFNAVNESPFETVN